MRPDRITYTDGKDLPWAPNRPDSPNFQNNNHVVRIEGYPDDSDLQGFTRVMRPEWPNVADSQF